MRIEKKQIQKEDGRYLVFYHFPESANDEQTSTFAALSQTEETISVPTSSVPTSSVPTKQPAMQPATATETDGTGV